MSKKWNEPKGKKEQVWTGIPKANSIHKISGIRYRYKGYVTNDEDLNNEKTAFKKGGKKYFQAIRRKNPDRYDLYYSVD